MSKASSEIRVLVQATQLGFQEASAKIEALAAQIEKLNAAGNQNSFGNIDRGMKTLVGTVTTLTNNINGLTQAFAKSQTAAGNFANKLTMQWNFKSIINDMKQMLGMQLRWYAVQPISQAMQTALYAPFQGAAAIGQYITEISQARGELTRWGATTGTVTDQAKRDVEGLLNIIQSTITQFPITFKDLSETVQAFIGAGIPVDVVKRMTADIARMKISFPEIDFKMFSIALTGAYNVFKDTIKGMEDQADSMSAIMDKILAAQATGIIRPEQFTTVLQYMSEIGKLEGFTLDEILALSVAITDTGIKANSASRLLASMTLSLQSNAGRATLLSEFGIQIDRALPLAQQFNQIIEGIKQKIGSGPISVGWMASLEKLVGKEQAKDLAALIDKLDRYKQVVKLIEDSHGGLIKASDAMMQTLPAQWLLLTNIVTQFGKEFAGSGIENVMKTVMGTFLDMAQGALAAADNTGEYSKQLDKLGEAGKTVYQVVHGIKEAFKVWGTALAPVGEAIKIILKVFDELLIKTGLLETAIKVLIDYLAIKLAVWAIPALIGSIGKLFGTLARLGADLALASIGFQGFGKSIFGLVKGGGPIALLLIALGAVEYLLDKINKKSVIEVQETNKFLEYKDTAKSSQLKVELEKLEKTPSKQPRIAELTKKLAEPMHMPVTRQEWVDERAQLQKDEEFRTSKITILRNELELRKRLNTGENPSKTAPAEAPPEDLGRLKSYGESELQSIKKIYGAGIDEMQNQTTTKLKLLDNDYKMGVFKTFEDYAATKEKILSDSEKATLWMLNDEEAALKDKYAQMRATIQGEAGKKGDDPKVTAANKAAETRKVNDQELADLAVLQKKREDIINKGNLRESKLKLDGFEQAKKNTLREIEDEYKLKEDQAHWEVDLARSNTRILENISSDMYDHLKLSATDYYDFLYGNIEKEAAKEKWLVDEVIRLKKDELAAKEAAIAALGKDAAKTPGLTPEDRARLIEQIDLLEKLAGLKKSQIDQKAVEQKSSLDLKGKYDPRKVYEDAKAANAQARFLREAEASATFEPPTEEEVNKPEEVANKWKLAMDSISDSMAGVSKVGDLALDELASKWLDTAKNIKDVWLGTTQSLSDTFESVFVDNMNGELKSLKDYFEAFTKAVLGMLFKIAAQEMAVMAMKGVSAAASFLFVHKGGVVGESSIPTRSVGVSTFADAPKFHKGLAPDEFPAILQKGEAVVPKSKVTKSIIDIIMGKTKEKEVTKESTTTQKTIENIVNLVTKRLGTEKISSDKQSVTELVTSYVEDEELTKAPKYHTGLVPDATLVQKDKLIAPPKSGIDRLLEKTKERLSEITATRSTSGVFNTINSSLQKVTDSFSSVLQKDSTSFVSEKTKDNVRYISDMLKEKDRLFTTVKELSNTLKEKNDVSKLFTSVKENENIAYLSDVLREKDSVSQLSDTVKEKTQLFNFLKEKDRISSVKERASSSDTIRESDSSSNIVRESDSAVDFSSDIVKEKSSTNILNRLFNTFKEKNSAVVTNVSTLLKEKDSVSNLINTINEKISIDRLLKDKVTVSALKEKDSTSKDTKETDSSEYLFDSVSEKENTSKTLKEKSSTNILSRLINTLNEKVSVDRLFGTTKEKESVSLLKDSSISEKEDASYISDTLKEKEKETIFARTNSVITTFVQKLAERFSTTLQKESIKDSSDTEKVSKNDTETRNSTIYRDKSALQELTEKVSSVLQKSESIVNDNVIYLSDVVKEKERVYASTSDSKSVVQKLTDAFTVFNKETSLTKMFEKVYSITEGIGSIVENTVNTTNINNANRETGDTNVSNTSEGAAAPAGVLSFHKGGLVPKFHFGGLVLPKFHGGGVVIPMFHGGGLNSDEREAILQTGERVLSREQTVMMDNIYNRVMNVTNNNGNNKPANIQVNIINQSSQNVKAEQKGTTFDLEKTVVSIVLKDMNTNGAIYGAVKGAR